jgi:hypothetical protein
MMIYELIKKLTTLVAIYNQHTRHVKSGDIGGELVASWWQNPTSCHQFNQL